MEPKQDKAVLMIGNQAVARGAWEAGVHLTSSYPGTPSTEITEYLSGYSDTYCEWAPNEKVALEVAVGASISGGRAMACMKHVGLNVAADPLFTAAYTGVRGGLVVVVADDPGMHSSQNEQDSRYYARSAHIPMLEPADSQEAKDYTALAFELSEQYDTPVLLRMTTRVAHSCSLVMPQERTPVPVKDYEKDIPKYVMMPANAKRRHVDVEKREADLAKDVQTLPINRIEMRETSVGVICSGIVYQYVREALPNASVLKLGMVYPLPYELIGSFAQAVDELVVIEELEPYIQDALNAKGIPCTGKEKTGLQGELNATLIGQRFSSEAQPQEAVAAPAAALPVRPPVLCPGCPHRAVFQVLHGLKVHAFGDIGCYTLGAAQPLGALDAVLCMGASLGMAHGAVKTRPQWAGETVSVIGDSTFLHSGITGLINGVYNRSGTVTLLLDNSTTGMTGHQDHAATGKDIYGNPAPQLDLEGLCRSVGARVETVDPFDMPALKAALEKALKAAKEENAASVVIARRPCALLSRAKDPAYKVNQETCKKCNACYRLACPAIEKREDGIFVNPSLCNGCGLCARVCRFGALEVQS